MYIDHIPTAAGHTGEAAASLFGKSIRDVTVDEAAFLAGIINDPISTIRRTTRRAAFQGAIWYST